MLQQNFDHFQTLSKTVQHVVTCCYRVAKCVQHIARNNVARFYVEILLAFGQEASRTLCLFSVELRLELQFFGVVQMDVRCFSLQCFGWAWYLANDTQFYIIAPAILFVAYRYELKRECICYQKKKFEQILKLTFTASFLQNLCLRNNSTVSRRVSFSSTFPPSQIIPFTASTRCKCFLGSLQKSKDSKMQ